MKNIHPIRMTKRRSEPNTFLVSSTVYEEIFGIIEFHRELGTMSNISIRALATAHIPTYSNPFAVGKKIPKSIRTPNVWRLLRQYAKPYFRLSFSIFRVNHRSGFNDSFTNVLLVFRTYVHCTMALSNTLQIIRRNAVIERESPLAKSIFLYVNNNPTITII